MESSRGAAAAATTVAGNVEWVTPERFAQVYGLTAAFVRKLCRKGEFGDDARKFGSIWRIKVAKRELEGR